MFIGWYHPDKKRTAAEKLTEACDRYRRKWGREPLIALVNVVDAIEYPGLEVRVIDHVAPNVFFVGENEPL